MIADKTLYQIALTFIPGVGAVHARNLINAVGDEEALFHEKRSNLKKIPGLSHRLIDEILNPEVLRRAEKELQFIDKHGIKVLFYTQEDYPSRLTNCIDAPVLLYCKGEVSYNLPKVVSVVGTRNASRYGLEWCRQFVGELSLLFPDILIVSGLAYGIDICAHRTAVENRVATVAVLAHGLDGSIRPSPENG